MAVLGVKHADRKVKKIGKKAIQHAPAGLKYGGRALMVGGSLLGQPELMALGAGAERVGSALEK